MPPVCPPCCLLLLEADYEGSTPSFLLERITKVKEVQRVADLTIATEFVLGWSTRLFANRECQQHSQTRGGNIVWFHEANLFTQSSIHTHTFIYTYIYI
jgi:hypothetical protein